MSGSKPSSGHSRPIPADGSSSQQQTSRAPNSAITGDHSSARLDEGYRGHSSDGVDASSAEQHAFSDTSPRVGQSLHQAYDPANYQAEAPAMHWQGEQHYGGYSEASNQMPRPVTHAHSSYGPQHASFAYGDPRSNMYREPSFVPQQSPQYAPPYNTFAQVQPGIMQQGLHMLPLRPSMGYAPAQQPGGSFAPGMGYALGGPYNTSHIPQGQYGVRHGPPRGANNQSAFPARDLGTTIPPTVSRTPSYPRGPPRKPKQSGFAVWVGNLSPGTTIEQLKDYFARGATSHIESVFLISKSNCAFVNYKSPESAQAAVARFHDSRLNGVRLVCRLRHGQAQPSSEGPAKTQDKAQDKPDRGTNVPDAASRMDSVAAKAPLDDTTKEVLDKYASQQEGVVAVEFTGETGGPGNKKLVSEKFFVVKSLTLQDLEASVRDGIWATQAHNESALNEAFRSAQTVYLIFSANKSGEYFGYARMRSAIDVDSPEDAARAEQVPASPIDIPTSTPTPATETAPPGRVVDDSARGTIFWEADSSSDSDNEDDDTKAAAQARRTKLLEEAEKQDWGKPFKIEWVSTTRLPFYRTRGLRNPWNANREIKIARDGTELEPSVGWRLLDMFHESGPQPPSSASGVSYQQGPTEPVIAIGSHTSGPPAEPIPSTVQ